MNKILTKKNSVKISVHIIFLVNIPEGILILGFVQYLFVFVLRSGLSANGSHNPALTLSNVLIIAPWFSRDGFLFHCLLNTEVLTKVDLTDSACDCSRQLWLYSWKTCFGCQVRKQPKHLITLHEPLPLNNFYSCCFMEFTFPFH